MVRPNKGDRQMVATRIPRQEYNKLHRYVELTGTTKSDFIRDVLLERLAEIDLDALNGNQGKFSLTA
jgi:predicted DNA-binding protein